MAHQSSREASLARRLALSTAGKTAEKRFSTSPIRTRSAAEARPIRQEAAVAPAASPAPVAPSSLSRPATHQASARTRAPLANPTRDLALARREALSKQGKRADTTKDRTRSDTPPSQPTPVVAVTPAAAPHSQVMPLFAAGSSSHFGAGHASNSHRNGPKRSA